MSHVSQRGSNSPRILQYQSWNGLVQVTWRIYQIRRTHLFRRRAPILRRLINARRQWRRTFLNQRRKIGLGWFMASREGEWHALPTCFWGLHRLICSHWAIMPDHMIYGRHDNPGSASCKQWWTHVPSSVLSAVVYKELNSKSPIMQHGPMFRLDRTQEWEGLSYA